MDTDSTSTQDKQITVDIPEDRVAEFYAWYARFLARSGSPRGRGPRGPGHRHGHRHGPGWGHGCGRGSQGTETGTEATVVV